MEFSIARAMRIANPSTPGPLLVSGRFHFATLVFQGLTDEFPRNFSPMFAITPSLIHFSKNVTLRQRGDSCPAAARLGSGASAAQNLCPISRKTARNPNRPNTCPPRELQASAKTFFAYCHLRFCWTCTRARLLSPPSRPFLRPTACILQPFFFAVCHLRICNPHAP
jgi:hypothetical protein